MKTLVAGVAFALVGLVASVPAEAKGCLKGAVVGGIAGHMAGHGVLGAAAGCAVGRHRANKQDRERTNAGQRPADQGSSRSM